MAISAADLLPGQLAAAWAGDETTAYLVHASLSAKAGKPLPWKTVRDALEEGFRIGLLERTLDSGVWPCDMGGAGAIKIRARKSEATHKPPQAYGARIATAELQAHEVQDFAEHIDRLREATAGLAFRVKVTVELGEAGKVEQGALDNVNAILGQVKPGWKVV